ncbi:hypothetical protein GCM10008965_57460 [Methylorubrum aminovorans]
MKAATALPLAQATAGILPDALLRGPASTKGRHASGKFKTRGTRRTTCNLQDDDRSQRVLEVRPGRRIGGLIADRRLYALCDLRNLE